MCIRDSRQHLAGLARLALRQQLADAHDGLHAIRQRSLRLEQHSRVGFAVILPALAVSDDDKRAARGLQHRRRNLARVGPFLAVLAVLRTDGYARSIRGGNGRGDVHEGRANQDLRMRGLRHQRQEFLEECGGFRRRLVHLPIAGQ